MLGTRAQVLLIDDDEVDFVITRKLFGQLETDAYELHWADSYEDGLRRLDRGCYDLCLLDYRLGDQDGLDLMRDATRLGCGTPVILLTGYGSDEVDRRALDLGASGFLDKSRLEARELERAMRYAMRREGVVTELLDQNTELLSLHRLTKIVLAGGGRLLAAAEEISRITRFPLVLLERYEPARRALRTLGACGLEVQPGARTSLDESPAGEVVLTGRAVLEMATEPSHPLRTTWVKTFACLPMHASGELIGVLTIASPLAEALDSTQIQRAGTVADHLGELIARVEDRGAQAWGPATTPLELEQALGAVADWFERGAAQRGQHLTIAQSGLGSDRDHLSLSRTLAALLGMAAERGQPGEVSLELLGAAERIEVRMHFPGLKEADEAAAVALGGRLLPLGDAYVVVYELSSPDLL